jgi:hypothetical protein
MMSSGMLRRVALVGTDVSEDRSASIIRVTIIGALGTTLVVAINPPTLRRNTAPKRRLLQESNGVNILKDGILQLGICTLLLHRLGNILLNPICPLSSPSGHNPLTSFS